MLQRFFCFIALLFPFFDLQAEEVLSKPFCLPSYQLFSGLYQIEPQKTILSEIFYDSRFYLKDLSTLAVYGQVQREAWATTCGYAYFGNAYYRNHEINAQYMQRLNSRLSLGLRASALMICSALDKGTTGVKGGMVVNYLLSESVQLASFIEYDQSHENTKLNFSTTLHHRFSSRINMSANARWDGQLNYHGNLTYRAASDFYLGLILSRGDEPISFFFTAQYLKCLFQFRTNYHLALGFSNSLSLCFFIK